MMGNGLDDVASIYEHEYAVAHLNGKEPFGRITLGESRMRVKSMRVKRSAHLVVPKGPESDNVTRGPSPFGHNFATTLSGLPSYLGPILYIASKMRFTFAARMCL
jgi:hypothetical protein